MRLIDADRLLRPDMIRMCYHLPNGDIAMPIGDIEHAPIVDAVPIIRCKDCINWDTDWTTHPPDHYCPAIDQFTSADFYCGYAEKKEVKEQDAAD